LVQQQKICYRIVASLQKTNNVKLTQLNIYCVCVSHRQLIFSLYNCYLQKLSQHDKASGNKYQHFF